jgi:hypothetical protein
MTRDDHVGQIVISNAFALLERYQCRVVYRMGGDLDGDPVGLDCSAFAARCSGQRKYDPQTKLWWNTDRIYADATGAQTRYRKLDAPARGCFGVYPGITVGGKRKAGHVFVVESVEHCATIECASSIATVSRLRRPAWFAPAATGNGRRIVWCMPLHALEGP